jgi:FMN phosphatase YigB (HAD superfamily)
VCFDLDGTLVRGHLHNHLVSECKVVPGAVPLHLIHAFLDSADTGLRHQRRLKATFEMLHVQGHAIAITTYSSFPEVVPVILTRLGLAADLIQVIHVVHGLPAKCNRMGKNAHIAQARTHFALPEGTPCVLVDDDPSNIAWAAKVGHRTVQADDPDTPDDPSNCFLDEIALTLASVSAPTTTTD